MAGQAQSFSGAVIFNISGVVTFQHGSSFRSKAWIKLVAQGLRLDRAVVQSPSLKFYHDSCHEVQHLAPSWTVAKGISANGLTIQASKLISIWCPVGDVNLTSSKLLVRSRSHSRGLSIYARNIYLEETLAIILRSFKTHFKTHFNKDFHEDFHEDFSPTSSVLI